MKIEKTLPLAVVAELTGYSIAALRSKTVRKREIRYRRSGRLILIPESEVVKLQGKDFPAVNAR